MKTNGIAKIFPVWFMWPISYRRRRTFHSYYDHLSKIRVHIYILFLSHFGPVWAWFVLFLKYVCVCLWFLNNGFRNNRKNIQFPSKNICLFALVSKCDLFFAHFIVSSRHAILTFYYAMNKLYFLFILSCRLKQNIPIDQWLQNCF